MKRTAAILIAVAAVLATLALVSLDRTEAASSPGKGLNVNEQGIPAAYGSDGTGIWVSGQGSISVAPDLANLDLGVETRAANVSEANSQASVAMDAIVEALEARGVKDEDIQTSRFSVYPRYNYVEEEVDGVSHQQGGSDGLPRQEQRDGQTARPRQYRGGNRRGGDGWR